MQDSLTPLSTFKDQFTFVPTIVNEAILEKYPNVVVAGMGGSAICVSLLKI